MSDKTMTVYYDEGSSSRTVNGLNGTERVERGKHVTVSEAVGKRLLAQGWKRTRKTTTSKTSTTKSTASTGDGEGADKGSSAAQSTTSKED